MFVVPISNDTFENSIFPFTQSRTTGSAFSTIDDFCSKIFLIFFRDATADEILFTSQPSASTGHVQFLLYSTYAASDPISICPFITEIPPSTVHIIGRRTPMKLNTGSYFTIVLASDILRS